MKYSSLLLSFIGTGVLVLSSTASTSYMFDYIMYKSSVINLSLQLIVDTNSMVFGLVVSSITMCVLLFSLDYMKEEVFLSRFIWLVLLFYMSMMILIFSSSQFFLLLGWDGLGLSSFALVIYYQNYNSMSGGLHTLYLNRIGDAIIIMGGYFLIKAGDYSMLFCSALGFFYVCILAAMTKSAQVPFSSWLPAAMEAPTPVSSLVHSSTLVTAGVFLMYRLICYSTTSGSSTMMMLVGSLTSFFGSLFACYENDLKKLVAFSTLSHLGIMFFMLGAGYPTLAFYHLIAHAYFKALLFMAMGDIILNNKGVQDLRLLGSGQTSPFMKGVLIITTFSLMALPFVTTYFTKHCLYSMMLDEVSSCLPLLLMLSSLFYSSLYCFRLLKMISWSYQKQLVISFDKTSFSLVNFSLMFMMCIFFGVSGISGNLVLNVKSSFLLESVNIIIMVAGSAIGLSYNMNTVFAVANMGYLKSAMTSISLLKSKVFKKLEYGWLEHNSYFPAKEISSAMVASYEWSQANNSMMRMVLVSLWVLYFVMSF